MSLSGPKAFVLLQLLIPLMTWSVVNVTADINDFRFISLDTIGSHGKRCVCQALMW